MSDWYILHDDHSVSKASTEEEKTLAYASMQGDNKIIAQDGIGNKCVSTVFLGLDHSYGGEGPKIFETMVFDEDHGEDCWRYATWQEALEGHRKACSELKSGFSREELEAAKALIEPLISSPDK